MSPPNAHGEKRLEPAFEDLCTMPFGKYKGKLLHDVPSTYLAWLWHDGLKGYKNDGDGERNKLANYVWNSRDEINQDIETTEMEPIV